MALFSSQPVPEDNISKDEQRIKNWEKVTRNFMFEPPTEEYYSEFSIKPGFWFWKTLATAETGLEDLKVLIPNTYIVLGNNNFYWLSYDRKRQMMVRKNEQQTTLSEFERVVYENVDDRYKLEDYYLLVHRSPGRMENEINKNVFTNFSWQSKRAMSSGVDAPSMLQEFVYPKGYHASITRICFKTSSSQEMRSSYGFKLTNFQKMHDKNSKKSISAKATICKDSEYSFDVSLLFSGTVNYYQPIMENVVRFLQKVGNAHITEIVADFIMNKNKEPVLYNVKSLKVVPNTAKLHKNIDELSCSVYCKLCGNMFKRDDARKLLTYKLLWEFEKHLIKRGINMQEIDTAHNSTRPCKVCDLCYTVVVSEHKLIEYEQKFALAQNVKIKDLFVKVKSEKRPKNRPHFVPTILRQWRFLLLIKEIRFEKKQAEFLQQMKFDSNVFFLHVKFGVSKFSFKVQFSRKRTETDYFVYEIKALKIYYFFSASEESIQSFLNDSEMTFKLSDCDSGNSANTLSQGSSKTMTNFKANTYDGQKHENVVYLFFGKEQIAPMKIIVGLVSDGLSDTSSLNLYKVSNVYFPDEDFYNCNILPGQWMEIFTEGHISAVVENSTGQKPDFKIKSNLMFLESVLEGKFNIQSSLLNVSNNQKPKNKRVFSNLSYIKKNPYQLEGRKSAKGVVRKRSTEIGFKSELKEIVRNVRSSIPVSSFKIKSSTVAPLFDVNAVIGKWLSSKGGEESLYRDYLAILKNAD